MTIGKKIRELRKKQELSQSALANELGFAQQTIYLWETDKYEPSLFNCICLADYFGISLDELACRDYKGDK